MMIQKTVAFTLSLFLLFALCSEGFAEPTSLQPVEKINRKQRRKRFKQPRIPENVTAHLDLPYAQVGDQKLLLNLFLPKNVNNPPLLVWIHGGGWRNGSRNGNGFRTMMAKGYAVASIDYRLSGSAIFPAQIHDCKAAIRFLRANSVKYKFNATKIGIGGSSAGGHLVALLGTSGGDKLMEGTVGKHLDQSSAVQAVCDLYGPTDLTQMDAHATPEARMRHNSPNSAEAKLIGGPIQENKEKAQSANPIRYVDLKDPPFLILHGDSDPVVPLHQSILLIEALQKKRVPSTLHVLKGASHGGRQFAQPAIRQAIVQFFDRHLKAKSVGSQPDAEGFTPLYNGTSFDGWRLQGGYATYHVEGAEIVGTTKAGSHNTFLCTNKSYGNFELRFEVQCDPELNSGVQIRSHVYEKETPQASRPKRIRKKGEVFGYQVEIASNGNAGRIWDEARHTQWLDGTEPPLDATQAAYKKEGWNSYRIVAKGNRIQTWINGTPVVDIMNATDATGFLGFQVHGIKKGTGPYEVRWRNIRIKAIEK